MESMPDRRIWNVISNARTLLRLKLADLGWVVLEDLKWRMDEKPGGENNFNAAHYVRSLNNVGSPFQGEQVREVQYAVLEAWNWLTANGLLAPNMLAVEPDTYFVTRAGMEATLEEFRGIKKVLGIEEIVDN